VDTPAPSEIKPFFRLTLGSIGVIFADIGTSPLYAFRQAAIAAEDGAASHEVVFGILSLILWTLILIVTCNYVLVLLRVDNNGEGGTLALMALARRVNAQGATILCFGIVGASLFFGDALITPAISVLAAIESLDVATPAFHPYFVELTVLVLFFLFAVQSRFTVNVAAWSGPIMTVWFAVIGLAGLIQLLANPEVLAAFNPLYGVSFLSSHGIVGFVTLGAVFLVATGAEALYAELGQFGRRPIQTAWFVLVLPALALNYLGQASLVLSNPGTIQISFFLLFPEWSRLLVIGLAIVTTVIASQTMITAAHSLARQAFQLGLLPRLEVRQTPVESQGQIYVPLVNRTLLIGVLLLVGLFRSSSALAAAYGIVVTGVMTVTICMAFVVIQKYWNWSIFPTTALMAPFFILHAIFLVANLLGISAGGWVSLIIAAAVMFVMYTWWNGTRLLFEKTQRNKMPLDALVTMLERKPPVRVGGTAVFLTSDQDTVPEALLNVLKHFKVLHEDNVILKVVIAQTPRVNVTDRVEMKPIGISFSRVTLQFGYMESPNIPRALAIARKLGWQFDIMSTSFFLSRRLLGEGARSGMPRLQIRLFVALWRNIKADAASHFQIPSGRVIEIGIQDKV
jgi:KUP system potassium uptake protein